MLKNTSSLLSQNNTNFLTEKTQEKLTSKKSISRTMEWLQIPPKTQAKFRENFIHIEIDYLQYTCYNIKEPLQNLYNILGFDGKIDQDNSNVEYNYKLNISLTNVDTRMGNAYIITFLSPGFPPIPIGSLEVYHPARKGAIKTEGKIVFYGGYFVFKEIIAEEAPEIIRFAKSVEISSFLHFIKEKKKEKPIYKRTRVDIAIDVKGKISQRWMYKYIKPSKNSKHAVKPYNYSPENGGFQSFGYIPGISKYAGIRVYNKVLDIRAKNKQSYHPHYGSELYPDVTRIELIFGGESATNDIETLLEYTKYRILGTNAITMKRKQRPKSQYSAISAYEYFKRYAKNHGKTLKEVIDDVTSLLITEEEKDKYAEMEIYTVGGK